MNARDAPRLALVLAAACDSGQSPSLTGIGEPIAVQNGQFIAGDLPGTPPSPSDGGVVASLDGGTEAGPSEPLEISNLGGFVTTNIQPGAAAQSFGGDVSQDAVAVGVRLARAGTGYWVVPVGAPDPVNPGFFTFGISASFDLNAPPGLQDLLFVAIGGSGNAGVQTAIPNLCVDSRIPDNDFVCYPSTQAPPKAVFTLEWDTNFDLDLHVVTPDGIDINPRTPYGGPVEAGVHGISPDLPHVDRDSLGGCVPDGLRQEDLIYPASLPSGPYTVYVDPFAACGQAAVRFKLIVSQSSGTCPGASCSFRPVSSVSGELLASQVTGGASPPTKIDQITVN